jgi:hypothetical protein
MIRRSNVRYFRAPSMIRDTDHRAAFETPIKLQNRKFQRPARDAAARGTLFGGLAASGWHTASITMRLMVESGLPLAGGIIGAGGEINWPKPTRPGDTLHVVSEIEEVTPSRSRPDRGTVRVRSETRNQRGEVVQVLIAKLIVPRRAPARDAVQNELATK